MNKRDQDEFNEQMKNPEFKALCGELLLLWGEIRNSGILMTTCAPMAHHIKEGKSTPIACVAQPGQDSEKTKAMATMFIRKAENLARRLSTFFPEHRRWHWQEIFISMALGGLTTVEQQQHGGRPRGRSGKTEDRLLALAQDYHETQEEYKQREERPLTEKEFLEDRKDKYRNKGWWKNLSVSTLQRALILYYEKRHKTNVK